MASIGFQNIGKQFRAGRHALRGIDLEIADGEKVVLVGPSGCGKSTLLRIAAGLEAPTEGRVLIGGEDVTGTRPQERDVALVFQNYALYPHMTVRDNLAFGLRMRGTSAAEREERVRWAAWTLGIDELLDRKPARLSGGERQRVALGRALVRKPKAFLLDEPLSNLDAQLRVRTRAEIARIHRQIGTTMLYVTHDQEEAMTLGDRVAVLRAGRLLQVAPPMEIYERPASEFVGRFIGAPAMNILRGTLRPDRGGVSFRGGTARLDLEGRPQGAGEGRPVHLGIRPEDIEIVPRDRADAEGTVDMTETLGGDRLLRLMLGDPAARDEIVLRVPARTRAGAGERLGLRFRRDRLHLFDAAHGVRIDLS